MAIEKKRGCGFRRVHGLYLCGSGIAAPCDRLPFVLKECDCCGFKPHMFRGFSWIHKRYLGLEHSESKEGCQCSSHPFSVCWLYNPEQEKYGFMWVSKLYYTPESFIKEALEMGVSKRVSYIPRGLKLGDWILVAYKKVPLPQKEFNVEGSVIKSEQAYSPAIFYAFKLQRIEYLIWKSEATPEYIKELTDKGLTPIIIADGDTDHV